MKKSKVNFLAQAAAIAAIYVVLTLLFAPLSYEEIQVRISEALTILPFFTSAAVPGLCIGCFLANILCGALLPDIIFGSIATLLGAAGSYLLRGNRYLVPVPPIISNMIIVPFILKYAYMVPLPIPFMMLTVGIGEVISCGILGMILLLALDRYKGSVFRNQN